MSLAYIRDTYGVPARRGMPVRYHPDFKRPMTGRICGASGPYVSVRFEGERRSKRIHPTDPYLVYLQRLYRAAGNKTEVPK